MADIKDRAREYIAKHSEYSEVFGETFVAVDTMTAMVEFAEQETKELQAQIEKMKIKWHDLEKDPKDLPKDYKTMCICLSDFGSEYEPVPRVCVGYCDSLGWSDYMGSSLYSTVRYWCELPNGR